MKHKFFKKAVTLALAASMLAGNVFTAFAQETQADMDTTTTYTEEISGGVENTDESSVVTDEAVADSEQETKEDNSKSIEEWASWTDWNNENFRAFLIDSLLWTDEENEAYTKAVTKESSESLEAFTEGLEAEDWEEILGTEVDPENPWAAFEEFITSIEFERNPGTGDWEKDENGIYYVQEDGTRAIGWYELTEDVWYYFDKEGYRQTGWLKDNGSWYYLSENGVMSSDVWSYIDGECYRFAKSGAMIKGWYKEDGIWYYFKSNGAMATDWEKVGNVWYYLDYDGAMLTGWQEIDGSWYYLSESGAMQTGWKKLGGTWYYLTRSGAMKTGWLLDAGKWYYLNEDGAMLIGWKQIGANWFYFYSSGAMAADTTIDNCYLDKNGYYISAYLSDEEIAGKLAYLKTKYPQGAYWNHMGMDSVTDSSEIITNTPCNHYLYSVTTYCNRYDIYNANIEGYTEVHGYQCAGFAFKLSDEIFGVSANRYYYTYDFDDIRVGDTIRTGDNLGMSGHSFVVTEKYQNYIRVAECNASNTCKITWNRIVTRSELDSEYKVTCETRRP